MKSQEFDQLLYRLGPCLSSEVVEELVVKHGLSSAAARKRVSRANGDNIKKIKGLFPRNETFVYHKNQFGSEKYWEALTSRLLSEGSAVGRALRALKVRGGVIPLTYFEIDCGSPIALQKNLSFQTVLERLKGHGFVVVTEVEGIGQCVCLADRSGDYKGARAALYARLVAEGLMLNGIRDWAKNIGLVSFETAQIRSSLDLQPNFSQFSWDFSAPSYVSGLVSFSERKAPKPGFFVGDVKLGSSLSLEDIKPFLHKCETVRSLKRGANVLLFLCCERFQKDAFLELKRHGVLPVTPESLFGRDVATSIRLLISTLAEVGRQVMDLDTLDKIFKGLSKFEGAISNLRGALFEYMVANILRETVRPTRLELNYRTSTAAGLKAETDVVLVYGNEARFVECKGLSPYSTLPDEEALKWVHNRMPAVRQFCLEQQDWKNKELVFELWITGKISQEIRQKLDKAIQETKKYNIRVLEAWEVREQAKAAGNDVYKLFNQHFLETKKEKSVASELLPPTSLAQFE